MAALVHFLVIVAVVVLVLWVVNRLIMTEPADAKFRKILNAVILIIFVLWVLSWIGLFGDWYPYRARW